MTGLVPKKTKPYQFEFPGLERLGITNSEIIEELRKVGKSPLAKYQGGISKDIPDATDANQLRWVHAAELKEQLCNKGVIAPGTEGMSFWRDYDLELKKLRRKEKKLLIHLKSMADWGEIEIIYFGKRLRFRAKQEDIVDG